MQPVRAATEWEAEAQPWDRPETQLQGKAGKPGAPVLMVPRVAKPLHQKTEKKTVPSIHKGISIVKVSDFEERLLFLMNKSLLPDNIVFVLIRGSIQLYKTYRMFRL